MVAHRGGKGMKINLTSICPKDTIPSVQDVREDSGTMQNEPENTLYYGDNLEILRQYIKDESVDLIYLDPPFNSDRNYNILFKDESGKAADAQITVFEDTWHWNETAEKTFSELVASNASISRMIKASRDSLGENQMMAYLVMMAVRLIELHRVLKPSGSIYLHCDPTASHYLKMMMDTIFGKENYRNEISRLRSKTRSSIGKIFRRAHDVLLFYAKSLFRNEKTGIRICPN
jgi:site-specific DNA-methyltransferase (adenine-specific)